MLHVVYGTNTDAVRKSAYALAKEVNGDTVVVSADTYESGAIRELVQTTSMFGETMAVLVDMPSSDESFQAETVDLLADMADSENTYIVIEGALLAPTRRVYEKSATSCMEYTVVGSERFNTFLFTDALSKKNKKQLWLLFQQAQQAGITSEEIIGVLWWQLKSIRIAAQTTSAAEAGMKEFPYKKAKQALRAFRDGEVEALSRSLLTVYHAGHSGEVAIETALEQWMLQL